MSIAVERPILHRSRGITSTIDTQRKTGVRSRTSRLRRTFLALALLFLCARWPKLKCEGQTSAGSIRKQPTHLLQRDDPEQRVDVIAPETYLIPMTPAAPIAVESVSKIDGGAMFTMQPGVMKILFCNNNIVHVSYAPGNDAPADSLAVIGCQEHSQSPLEILETPNEIRLSGDTLSIRVIRRTGALSFFTKAGNEILSE